MEAYKTTCPDCKNVRFWAGYKTGLGKTPEQLKRMQEEQTVCARCGSKRAVTELDRESEVGQVYGEMDEVIGRLIVELISEKEN